MKALHSIQKLRIDGNESAKNQALFVIQVHLLNFVTTLESQHAELVSNIFEDVLPDFRENQSIQDSYRECYVWYLLFIDCRILH